MKISTISRFLIFALSIALLGYPQLISKTFSYGNIEPKPFSSSFPISVFLFFESLDSTFNLNNPSRIKDVFDLAKSAYYRNEYDTSIDLHQRFIALLNDKDSQICYFPELLTSYSQLADVFYRKNDQINSIHYNKLAVKLVYKENLPLENYWFYFYRIGRSYYSLSDFTNSLIYYLESEKLNRQPFSNSYTEEAAVIKNNIGLCYLKLGLKDPCIRNFCEAITMYDNLNKPKEKGKILNNIALVYQENNDFNKSLEYFHKSLDNYRSVNDTDNVAIVLNNIGNLYLSKNDFKTSINFYFQALNAPSNKNFIHNNRNIAFRNNLSLSYLNLGMIDSASFHNSICQGYFDSLDLDNLRFLLSDYFYTNTDRIDINLAYYYSSGEAEFLLDSFETFKISVLCLLKSIDKDFNLLYANPFLQAHKSFFDKSMQTAKLLDKLIPITVPRTSTISEIFKTLSVLNFDNELNLLNDDLKIEKHCKQTTNSFNFITDFLASDNKSISSIPINIDSLIIEDHSNQNFKIENKILLKNQIIHYINNINSAIESKIGQIHTATYLDYYITSDEVFIHSYCQNQIKLYCIKTKINLDSTISNFVKAIKSINVELVDSIGKVLGESLITPLMSAITTHELIIIPESLTSRIPFDVLKCRSQSGKLDFLINQFEIYCSVTLLDRNFSGEDQNKKFKLDFCGFSSNFANDTMTPPPHNKEEINVIASNFINRNFCAQVFDVDSLTLENIFKNGINSRVFHISTHSLINDTLVALNRLALSDDLVLLSVN